MTRLALPAMRSGLLYVLALVACDTRGGQEGTSARPIEDVPALATFVYACDDGSSIVANHREDDGVTLFLSTGTVRLPWVPSDSGVRYADGDIMWWRTEWRATLERAGSPVVECEERRRRSVIEDAKLRGADYWATGNEPGWRLEIAHDSIRFITGYGTEHYRFATPTPSVDADQRTATYVATASDHALSITIRHGRCLDSMSDEAFEGSVALRFDGADLRGCGMALH